MPLRLANEPGPQTLGFCWSISSVPSALPNSIGIPLPISIILLGVFSLKMSYTPLFLPMALLEDVGILALTLMDVPLAPSTASSPSDNKYADFHKPSPLCFSKSDLDTNPMSLKF